LPEYPIVECLVHPGVREPGYIVCRHVLNGDATIGHFERATPTNCGLVCCDICYGHRRDTKYNDENLTVACAQCARVNNLLVDA
jgi:hypothetical protein